MEPVVLAYLAGMTVLLMPAQKWSGMDPFRIEGGPSWLGAFVGASYTMILFVLAEMFKAGGHPKVTAFLGSFAFGTAIGGCYRTTFNPSPEEVPEVILRWWTARVEAFWDATLKAGAVVVAGPVVSWIASLAGLALDGRYWVAVCLAFYLVAAKARLADGAIRPWGLRRFDPLVEAYIDELADRGRKGRTGATEASLRLRKLIEIRKMKESDGKTLEAGFRLYLARRRMLIGGNVYSTMIAGAAGLAGWLLMASPVMATWHEPDYYTAAFGFFAGVGFTAGRP
jgi:hypothetical protein